MELITSELLGFALVVTRISAFLLIAPVFGWRTIPVRIKVAVTVLLGIFFSVTGLSHFEAGQVTPIEAVLLLADEASYGFALGLIASVLFSVVKIGGRIIERQMGLAMAQVLDPFTGERSQPLGSLLEMIFILIFLSANGHHIFLLLIEKSYEAFPAGHIPTIAVLARGVVSATSAMLTASLRLAAPILAAFILLLVALAILARIVPEMNIFFISFPLRVGLGLWMVAMFIPFIQGFVSEFANLMSKLIPI